MAPASRKGYFGSMRRMSTLFLFAASCGANVPTLSLSPDLDPPFTTQADGSTGNQDAAPQFDLVVSVQSDLSAPCLPDHALQQDENGNIFGTCCSGRSAKDWYGEIVCLSSGTCVVPTAPWPTSGPAKTCNVDADCCFGIRCYTVYTSTSSATNCWQGNGQPCLRDADCYPNYTCQSGTCKTR